MIQVARRGVVAALATLTAMISLSAHAQVLDAPDFYVLPPQNPQAVSEAGLPATINVGEIDANLVTDIGGVPLNDLVVMGVPTNVQAQGSPADGRIWTLTHTSGSDTQALQVLAPVDVPISPADPSFCYEFPSSVQILDLDGDDQNDLAFIGPSCEANTGFSNDAIVLGIQGNTSDPFQNNASLTLLGAQVFNFGISDPIFDQVQSILASADLDGDGLLDLVFPDLDDDAPANLVHSLLNDGTLAALPFELSTVNGPFSGAEAEDAVGFTIATGDFDGNGTQDAAIAYFSFNSDVIVNEFFVYSGNGDGTFASEPLAQVAILPTAFVDFEPFSVVAGNFDNNDFSDFAVTYVDDESGNSALAILTCSPGQPATCEVATIPTGTSGNSNATNLAVGDFNNDGLDDLVNVFNPEGIIDGVDATALVHLRLNNAGQFSDVPDQVFSLDTSTFPESIIPQIIAKDIDACGGPDLAYMGVVIAEGGKGGDPFEYQAAVAYNPNEAPVANAGAPVTVSGGIQVGGAPGGEPTCSDPTDDLMVISWTVVSGTADISDTSSANPIVTSSSANAVLQVTCTDACGLSDTSTVTLPANNFIQGSCGTSLTGTMSAGFNATWLAIPALLGMLGMLRRFKA